MGDPAQMLTSRSMNATRKDCSRRLRQSRSPRRWPAAATSKLTTGSPPSLRMRGTAARSSSRCRPANSPRPAICSGEAYASNPSDKADRVEICAGAADERPYRPVARRHAQAGHRLPGGAATCSPPTARRSPAPANSSRRSMPCAARRRRNIRTGSWCRRKARSSTRWASPTRRARSTAGRSTSSRTIPSVLSNLGMSYVLEGDLPDRRDVHAPRRPSSPAPTAACARTWRWSSACRAASTKPRRSPARNCRRNRRQANVAYLRAHARGSRTPGASSRTKTNGSTNVN